ncbi:MAG: NAD(P)/FAD-dependent oxidoreductase [Gemmataceae bacterium]
MSNWFFRGFRHLPEAPGPTRREILAAALTASGGVFLRDCCAAAPAKKKSRVVVIGAGLAGLACADELAFAGYDVTVIEARDRLAGRVISRTDLIKGKVVEGGGELVGPNQPTWMAYGKRFGFEFLPLPDDPTDVVELNGKVLEKEKAQELYKEWRTALRKLNDLAERVPAYSPWEAPRATALDRQSLADWIARQDVSADCKAAMAVQMTAINGAVPAWQSLLMVLAMVKGGGLDKFWDETDTLHVKGGCQQLATRLAVSLRKRCGFGAVRLGRPVRAIRLRQHGTTIVELRDGSILEAEDVVLTAPASVWNRIDFDPALPTGLTMPLADNVKFLAVSKGRPWADAKRSVNALSNGAVQLTWETTAGQGDAGHHAVVAISGGPAADECRSWAPDQREVRYRDALNRFWPGYTRAYVSGELFNWLSDPFSRGSYSVAAPGQVTVAGPLLAKGVGGRLHFAGEHCCFAFLGWMEGALSSGVRLARKLAERDGLVTPAAR